MTSLFEGKIPLSPISIGPRPFSVRNSMQSSSGVFQPLEPNSCKITKNKDFFNPNVDVIQSKTFYKERKKSDIHPLDFYTLGKIPSNIIYPCMEWNKGIKSTSNNILERNALSINTKKFNGKNIHKKLSNLYEQNITENNYMDPLSMYKTYEKYNIPKYATNREIYNIMKEKYFSRDIVSPIAKGKCLSQKEFIKQREKMNKKENLNLDNISSNKDTKFKEVNLKNKKEEIKEKNRSFSHTQLRYKDPNDYTKQTLKNNTFYFDKNSNQMLQQKKWLFENKK